MIVDIHTHAFPDSLAERAMAALTAEVEDGIEARGDGTVGGLVASMDRAGVAVSVLACIATRPAQYERILDWCRQIASPRVIPFPSVHPADPEAAARIDVIAEAGFKGIKLHPYYQEFVIDEERLFPVYERLQANGLVLLCHTGFDIAYPRDRIADPEKVARVVACFPDLKFLCSHLGAWEDWDEVRHHLLGRPIRMDLSFSLDYLDGQAARELLLEHPADCLFFGSDWPWDDQERALNAVRALDLPADRLEALLGGNARRLLNL